MLFKYLIGLLFFTIKIINNFCFTPLTSLPLPVCRQAGIPQGGTFSCQITATLFHVLTLSNLFSTSALLGVLPPGGARGGTPPKSPRGDF